MFIHILLSPAKRVRSHIDFCDAQGLPVSIMKTKQLLAYVKTLDVAQIQKMLVCSERIARWSLQCYQKMQLTRNVVPSLLAFDGIQYTYMRPDLFCDEAFAYARQHIRILSGFYGVLRPFDGIVPYRLELNNSFVTSFCHSLYDFWGEDLYRFLVGEDCALLDLCSQQYSKAIRRYKEPHVKIVSCRFCEQERKGIVEKGVYVKMARGEMARWLCTNQITTFEEVKRCNVLGYVYEDALSTDCEFVFLRTPKNG